MAGPALDEIARQDWARYRCGCGQTAEHLREILVKIITLEPQDRVGDVLDDHIEHEAMLFEAAVPTSSVIVAALADDGVQAGTQDYLTSVLWRLVGGESHPSEIAIGREDLAAECQEQARLGIWLLYRQAMRGDAETVVEEDEARLSYFAHALRGRLEKQRRSR